MIDYGKFKSLESDQVCASDGGIVISIEELGDRIATAETFLKKYPDSKQKNDVLQNLKHYLQGYFGGLPNTTVATTDSYNQSFINAYKTYLKIHPDTSTSTVLQTYYNDQKATSFAAPYDESDPASTMRFNGRVEDMADMVVKDFGNLVSNNYYLKATENLNLRNPPELTSEILWVIPKGTIVKSSMTWKDWVIIESAGWSGFTTMGYLTPITLSLEKQLMTSMNLNLRQEPSLDSPVLMVIPAQTIVEVESIVSDWGKTTYAGKTGYVSTIYLIKP